MSFIFFFNYVWKCYQGVSFHDLLCLKVKQMIVHIKKYVKVNKKKIVQKFFICGLKFSYLNKILNLIITLDELDLDSRCFLTMLRTKIDFNFFFFIVV